MDPQADPHNSNTTTTFAKKVCAVPVLRRELNVSAVGACGPVMRHAQRKVCARADVLRSVRRVQLRLTRRVFSYISKTAKIDICMTHTNDASSLNPMYLDVI